MTYSETLLTQLTELVTQAQARRASDDNLRDLMQTYVQNREGASDELVQLLEAREKCTAPLKALLRDFLRQSFADASKSGALGLITPADGPTIFHEIWTTLERDGWDALPDYRHEDLANAFTETMVERIVFATDPASDSEIAETLMDVLMEGNLPPLMGAGDILLNFADGKQCHISMKDWTPELYSVTKDGTRIDLYQMPKDIIFHEKVDFPSGRLIIADAIHVDNFGEQMFELRNFAKINVNYAEDRIRRTAICALIGVVDVAMGSDGPSMVKDPKTGRLIAGRSDDTYPEVASVVHDYWGTTIIDRKRLVDLICGSPRGDKDRQTIEVEVDAWLAESRHHTEVTVEPGTWHLYWDDDRTSIQEILSEAGYSLPDDARFVLSPDPLDIPAEKMRDYATQE